MPRQLGQWVRKSAGLRSLGRLARMPADNVRFPEKKQNKKTLSLFTEKQRGGKNTTGHGVQGRGAAGVGSLKITGGRRLAGGMCQQHRTEHLEPAKGKRPRSDVRRSTAGAATRHVTTPHAERLGTESMHRALAWANYGPGAVCSPLSFIIRPAEHEEIILIASK